MHIKLPVRCTFRCLLFTAYMHHVHSYIIIMHYMCNCFDRTYMALETLIEPHQLVAVLQCVAAVGRILLSGGWGRYVHTHTHFTHHST